MLLPTDESTTVYECPICRDVHSDQREAHICCKPPPLTRWQCRVCEKVYPAKVHASRCCELAELERLLRLFKNAHAMSHSDSLAVTVAKISTRIAKYKELYNE